MRQDTQSDLNLESQPLEPLSDTMTTGQWLVHVRKANGMSAQDVASRTNRALTQIMALEADDYSHVGEGVLLRAIVRHYAKVVGADQDEAIRHLPLKYQAAQPTLPDAITAEHPTRGMPLKSPWIGRIWLILLALVVFGLLGYWMFVSRFLQTNEVAQKVTEPNQVQVVSQPAAPTTTTETVPPATTPTTVPSTTDTPIVDSDTAALNAPTVAPNAAINSGDTLTLKFKADSWVEIKDAEGKVLLSGSQIANTEQSVSGKTPLKVKIGGASQVDVTWKGAPYDLTPLIKGDVVRINELN
jgi:cytoskeleton protein RodZ